MMGWRHTSTRTRLSFWSFGIHRYKTSRSINRVIHIGPWAFEFEKPEQDGFPTIGQWERRQ